MILNLIILLITVFCSISFVLFLAKSGKYDSYTDALDEKDFPLKQVYGAGFVLAETLKLDYRSKYANSLRQEVTVLYGDKYCEFYIRVIYAQRFALTWLTLIIGNVLSCMTGGTDSLIIFAIGVAMAFVVFYYFSTQAGDQIKKRSVLYMKDFPGIVSTIALLVNAGMMLREAWAEVAYSDNTNLHQQMQQVSVDMNNGMSEADALYKFSLRCATPEIKKFTSFIVQGLEKGNKDLAFSLKNQSDELWERRKQLALQQGELAASRLLIPIMVMFVGILVVIMGPIMTNLGI